MEGDYGMKECTGINRRIGLGKLEPYWCGPNHIWLDDEGNRTSRCREEFPKKKTGNGVINDAV